MKIPVRTTPALRALCLFAFAFTTLYIFFYDAPPGPPQRFGDKVVHAVVYGGMAFMLWLGLAKRWAVGVFLVLLAIGAGDEIHQSFTPGRFADPLDLLADAVGAAVVLLVSKRVIV